MWAARFQKVVPELLATYPRVEFIFLTLTVRNISIGELRETLGIMTRAWKRLSERRQFPGLGFVRSLEVTYSTSEAGNAHPHFHCLIAVDRTYFIGRNYIKQDKWRELWRDCLRADYLPQVNVKKVRPKKGIDDPVQALTAGLIETVKYETKPDDLASDRDWLIELTRQTHKTRAIAVGGIFREFLNEEEPEDLISENDSTEHSDVIVVFDWKKSRDKYVKL
jgi:plasmid rolling circle replication initiator protein Rep